MKSYSIQFDNKGQALIKAGETVKFFYYHGETGSVKSCLIAHIDGMRSMRIVTTIINSSNCKDK